MMSNTAYQSLSANPLSVRYVYSVLRLLGLGSLGSLTNRGRIHVLEAWDTQTTQPRPL